MQVIPIEDIVSLKSKTYGYTIRSVRINNKKLYSLRDLCRAVGYKSLKSVRGLKIYRKECLCEVLTRNNSAAFSCYRALIFTDKAGVQTILGHNKTSDNELILDISKLTGIRTSYIYHFQREEIEFINLIDSVAHALGCAGIRQYKIGSYFIDYYIPDLHLAIEYDENGHRYYDKKAEKKRQKYIETKLRCIFCRVSNDDNLTKNLKKILVTIINLTKSEYERPEESDKLVRKAVKWYEEHDLPIPNYLLDM